MPPSDNIDNYWPLHDIVQKLSASGYYEKFPQLGTFQEWERKRESTGFPEPATTLGKYKLYDINEVEDWYILWTRVTARLGRGDALNGTREDS